MNQSTVLWATDLHIDSVKKEEIEHFFQQLKKKKKILFFCGDLCDGDNCLNWLSKIQKALDQPVYFVFGNHDFYYNSFSRLRDLTKSFLKKHKNLHYLTTKEEPILFDEFALIGDDGLADGVCGDFFGSMIQLRDYELIDDLSFLLKKELKHRLFAFGKKSAKKIRQKLERALQKKNHVVCLTHTPPFEEACLYDGKPGDKMWTPHFTSTLIGDSCRLVMKQNPQKKLTILCGHTHHKGIVHPEKNIKVIVGDSFLGINTLKTDDTARG